MEKAELEALEIDLLLEGIFRRYGYDFRSYARASIERRVRGFLGQEGLEGISQLIPLALYQRPFFERIVRHSSITVTDMFRDPEVYRALRSEVIPLLRTYPFVRVWHAGCATGEEVYSLAILLKEEGLYERTTIFATDFNDEALRQAEEGIYDLAKAQAFTSNYQQGGGTSSFSDYYQARYGGLALDGALKKNITFANHNLVADGVFSEMHLVLCRNVMIYFNSELQDRALSLFRDSLVRGGFLCLGRKESLHFSAVKDDFQDVVARLRIFSKRSPSPGEEE